jgi:hypothetical protein
MTADPADFVCFGLLGVVDTHRIWPFIQITLEVSKCLASLRAVLGVMPRRWSTTSFIR